MVEILSNPEVSMYDLSLVYNLEVWHLPTDVHTQSRDLRIVRPISSAVQSTRLHQQDNPPMTAALTTITPTPTPTPKQGQRQQEQDKTAKREKDKNTHTKNEQNYTGAPQTTAVRTHAHGSTRSTKREKKKKHSRLIGPSGRGTTN